MSRWPRGKRSTSHRTVATTQPKKKSRLGGKRVWIAVGVVALLVVAYVWYQNRSGNSLTGPLSTGGATDQTGAGAGDAGGLAGSPTDTSQSTDPAAAVLSTLSGENQALLGSLLSSQQGLASLVGSSLGSPTPTIGSEGVSPFEIPGPSVTTTDPSGISAPVAASPAADVIANPVYPTDINATLAPVTASTPVVQYDSGPSVSTYSGETEQQAIDAAAAAVAPTYNVNPSPAPSLPTNQGAAPRSGGTSSNKKQGVYSTH